MLFLISLFGLLGELLLEFLFLPLFLLFIHFVPLVHHVLECGWIVAVPAVPLRLIVELACHHLILLNVFIVGEVPLQELRSHLPRPLGAGLRVVSHGPAVGAGALPVFSYLLVGARASTTPEPGVVDSHLRLVISRTLVLQHFLVLLVQIPRSLLDILGHVGQVHLGLGRGRRRFVRDLR